MQSLRSVLAKVMPILRDIEELPVLTVVRAGDDVPLNPFSTTQHSVYDVQFDVDCVYSENPEIVTNSSNIMTQHQTYFYVMADALGAADPTGDATLSLNDRFIFRGYRYRPVDIQELFGLWKVKVNKQ